MKYRVINIKTKEDITDKCCWVVRPDGKLYVNEYGDLIGYPDAMYLPESAMEGFYSTVETLKHLNYFNNSDLK